MDSGFVDTMVTALDTLSEGFSSFTGKTITGDIWNGDAADNAKNQVSEKIDPKVEAAKEKLANLKSAIAEAQAAQTAKENMAEADRCIAEIKSSSASDSEKSSEIDKRQKEKEKFEKEFNEHVDKVKSLCGS